MSYAPIYNKLRELEDRVALMESAPKTTDEGITIAPLGLTSGSAVDLPPVSDAAIAAIADELSKVKADFDNLLKECSANSSAITQLSTDLAAVAAKEEVDAATAAAAASALSSLDALATKEEVAVLATKEEVAVLATKEEVAVLATKEEVADLATKEEVADLVAKFDNVINVISQLNAKIMEANDKISALEDN